MAVAYTGLTIQFAGDTTKLQDALKKIQRESKATNQDLKEIDRSLKFHPGNTDLLQQKARNLNKAYQETKERLDAYKQALEQLEAKKQRGEQLTEQEQRQYENLQRSILTCKDQLDRYKSALEGATKEAEASETALYQLGQKLEDNSEKFERAGKAMQGTGTVMVGASTAIVGASVAAFNEVDAGMDAVVKATGATGEAAQALGQDVKNVAGTVAGASRDWETIGNVVGEVNTRFGFTNEQLDATSEQFFKFSEVTGIDAVQGVQLVSRAMGDAGIESDQLGNVLDALTAAAQNSGISVDKLTTLLTSYGAPMRALGFDTESSIAIFSQWEKAGVNTETAFSGMKKAISNWSAEGKDARVEFSKTLEEIAACPDIASATTKAIEVFGAKAGPDLADAIQGGRFEYQEFLDIIEGSEGTLNATFDETVDGVDEMNVSIKEAQAAGAELGEQFSTLAGPVLHELADMARGVADRFRELSPEQKEMAAKAVIAVGAIGGLAIGLGKLIAVAGKVGTAIKFISTNWGAVTAFVAANPIGLSIAAVAVAIAGLTWFFTQTETGKKLWASFTSWITEKWKALKTSVTNTAESLKKGISDKWNAIKTGTVEKWESIKSAVTATVDGIKNKIQVVWNVIKMNVSNTMDGIKSTISDKINAAKDAVSSAIDRIKGLFNFKISWPHIPLPHFSVSGSANPLDWLKNGVPKISVDWYAKGNGVFPPNSPQIIGVGDNRYENEYLNTESQLESVVASAMAKVMGVAAGVNVSVAVNATISGVSDAYTVGQSIGRGVQSVLKQRGASYA